MNARSSGMRDSIRAILFKIQTVIALVLVLHATQKESAEWVSISTACGLAIWSAVSIVLLFISEDYLIRKFPWSLIAVVLPAIFWLLIALAIQLDISYAGLLTPFWIAVGLNYLALHHHQYDDLPPSTRQAVHIGHV